jgi:hypothetical protein
MENHLAQIIDNLWHYAGDPILNNMYKTLLQGGEFSVGDNIIVRPEGVVIVKKSLFSGPKEYLAKWEELDFNTHATANELLLKRIGEHQVEALVGLTSTSNGLIFYSLLRWLYEDSDRIAAIYTANNIRY